jgi:hypothetical protein
MEPAGMEVAEMEVEEMGPVDSEEEAGKEVPLEIMVEKEEDPTKEGTTKTMESH